MDVAANLLSQKVRVYLSRLCSSEKYRRRWLRFNLRWNSEWIVECKTEFVTWDIVMFWPCALATAKLLPSLVFNNIEFDVHFVNCPTAYSFIVTENDDKLWQNMMSGKRDLKWVIAFRRAACVEVDIHGQHHARRNGCTCSISKKGIVDLTDPHLLKHIVRFGTPYLD